MQVEIIVLASERMHWHYVRYKEKRHLWLSNNVYYVIVME